MEGACLMESRKDKGENHQTSQVSRRESLAGQENRSVRMTRLVLESDLG